jgi:hypothetical protein
MQTCVCDHTKGKHRYKKVSYGVFGYICGVHGCPCKRFVEDLSKKSGFSTPGLFRRRERLFKKYGLVKHL